MDTLSKVLFGILAGALIETRLQVWDMRKLIRDLHARCSLCPKVLPDIAQRLKTVIQNVVVEEKNS